MIVSNSSRTEVVNRDNVALFLGRGFGRELIEHVEKGSSGFFETHVGLGKIRRNKWQRPTVTYSTSIVDRTRSPDNRESCCRKVPEMLIAEEEVQK